MTKIALEDNFTDIVGKAQRGLQLSDETLARQAKISLGELNKVKEGEVNEIVLKKLAQVLGLGEKTLLESASQGWYPHPVEIPDLAQFNTPYHDMTVNAYLAWDPHSKEAVVFDTGATCDPILEFAKRAELKINLVLLTHTHPDHIAELPKLKKETGAPAYVCHLEPTPGAERFEEGRKFKAGSLEIETRQTSGHSAGGITYVIYGLARPVAVVGDAIFAGSMGGGAVSYADALENNRKKILTLAENTIICPGHGPLTTVGEEKIHNPFYPEFQNR